MQSLKSTTKLILNKFFANKIYVRIAALFCLFLIGIVLWKTHEQPQALADNTPIVSSTVIGATQNVQSYFYPGQVRGRYESQLSFQVNGKIIKRNVQLGSKVNAGDALLEIDAKDVIQTVNNNSAQVYSSESQLELAESNLNRYRELLAGGAISQSQYDQYATAYKVAAAGLRQASAQYEQGSNQLNYTSLIADKPGIVSNISAEIGQVVNAGQTIVTVVQDGEREVEISVPENRIEELRNASEIKVSFWAMPDLTIAGQVREISPMADQTTRTFKVRITLINPPAEIKLGMTANVNVISSNIIQAVNIPLTAIYQTTDTPSVWVVTENNTLALRPITAGKFGTETLQVLNGLQQGDRIVTKGVHRLKEGQSVRLAGESL